MSPLDRLRPLLNDPDQWHELVAQTDTLGVYRTVVIGGEVPKDFSDYLTPWRLWCTTTTHIDADEMGVETFTVIQLRPLPKP